MEDWDFCIDALNSIKGRKELWEAGAEKYMIEASTSKEGAEQARMLKFMAENKQELTGSTKMWEATGSALCQGNMDGRVCKFMSDWQQRPDVTAKGIYALACSLWTEKREHEADKVSSLALTKEIDWSIGNHRVLLALYQIVHGAPQVAVSHIQDVDPLGLPRRCQCKYEAIICVLTSLSNGEPYAVLQKRIDDHYNKYETEFGEDKEIKYERKLVQQGIARLHGKKWAAFKWKYLK